MRPRVMFLTPGLALGGAERWILSLCKLWRDIDVAGILVTHGIWHTDAIAEARALGVPLLFPTERVDCNVVLTWGVPDIRKHIGPTRKPVVLASHACPAFEEQTEMLREAAWQATHWTAVCNEAALSYPADYQPEVVVLANGVDSDRVEGESVREQLGLGDKVVLWIGRFEDEKRPGLVIDAMRCLPSGWSCVMVGDGPLREACAKQARGIRRRIVMVNPTTNVGGLYQSADVFCLPSRTEAMPLVMLEAWAAGVRVVTTATGFASEHADVQTVVPVEVDAEGLADGIITAFESDGHAAKMLAEGEYSGESMAARWSEYLSEVVNG